MTPNYTNYQKMIYKLAWKWSSRDVHWEDLLSEGNEAFMIAARSFDPNNGTGFGTYLYRIVDNAMHDFAVRGVVFGERKIVHPKTESDVELLITNGGINPERYAILKDWLENLSKESQLIIRTVWETPGDIVEWAREETHNPKNSRKYLTRYLRELGWNFLMVENCFQEIKEGLKEL